MTAVVVASYFKQLYPQKEVVWLSVKSEGSLLMSFKLAVSTDNREIKLGKSGFQSVTCEADQAGKLC